MMMMMMMMTMSIIINDYTVYGVTSATDKFLLVGVVCEVDASVKIEFFSVCVCYEVDTRSNSIERWFENTWIHAGTN